MPLRIAILFCYCLLVGCGSSKPYGVQAVVTLDGKPFAEAKVTLLSARDESKSASGVTDAEGNVTFKAGEAAGVLAGSYIVIVSKAVEEKKLTNDEIRALAELGIRYKPPVIEFAPEKYTRRETSDLKMKVGYWSSKKFTFDLRSD